MTTSAKYRSRSENENAEPMITSETKNPTVSRIVGHISDQTLV